MMLRVRTACLTALLIGTLTMGGCDLLERIAGTDRLQELVRNNPVDPGGTATPVDTGLQPSAGNTVQTPKPVLQWAAQEGVASYSIQVSESKSFTGRLLVDDSAGTGSRYEIGTVLQDGHTYYWRVQPHYAEGQDCGWSETFSFSVAFPKPLNPVPADGNGVGEKCPLLRWEGVPEGAMYRIQICERPDFTGTTLQEVSDLPQSQYQVSTALTAHRPCYWRVRAQYDPDTTGPWSAAWSTEWNGLLWKYDTGDDFTNSSISIGFDGTIYVPTQRKLSAIRPDGTLAWEKSIERPTSPVVSRTGAIYVSNSRSLFYAISSSGSEIWHRDAHTAMPPAMGADGTLYIGDAFFGCLLALNPDGSEKWRTTGPGISLDSSPTVSAQGTIFGGHGDAMYAFNPDGSRKWQLDENGVYWFCERIVADRAGSLYVVNYDSPGIYAYDSDGQAKWHVLTSSLPTSPCIDTDGTLYWSEGYKVRAVRPDGTTKWTADLQADPMRAGVLSAPALGADGTIILEAGALFALSRDGTLLWRTFMTDQGSQDAHYMRESPRIGADGTVFAYTLDNRLYAIQTTCGGPAASAWPMSGHDAQRTSAVPPP